MRQKYAANSVLPANPQVNPSAASLVWDWLSRQPHFNDLPEERRRELAYLVELIRAYDTWDWQNDPEMAEAERVAADELDQLFWSIPCRIRQPLWGTSLRRAGISITRPTSC